VTTLAVVEDNADNRLLLHAILDDQYDLVEFDNGADALAGLGASQPEGMDGNEILARIRADAQLRLLPVIALTAHAMAGDREKYLASGFNDYVTKPIVDEEILLGAIEKWLAVARAGGLG
jgi:two-component system cell cycle response regulator DivK